MVFTGAAKASTCRIHRPRSETNQQLVYQSKKTPLEAFWGYAVCHDGCCISSILHGKWCG